MHKLFANKMLQKL